MNWLWFSLSLVVISISIVNSQITKLIKKVRYLEKEIDNLNSYMFRIDMIGNEKAIEAKKLLRKHLEWHVEQGGNKGC